MTNEDGMRTRGRSKGQARSVHITAQDTPVTFRRPDRGRERERSKSGGGGGRGRQGSPDLFEQEV